MYLLYFLTRPRTLFLNVFRSAEKEKHSTVHHEPLIELPSCPATELPVPLPVPLARCSEEAGRLPKWSN